MNYNFMRFPNFRDKAVTLSYDGGVIYDKRLIEIMNKNGIKGTFNINSGMFGDGPNDRRLSKEDALKLYKDSGHEVAVHGTHHLPMEEVEEAVATADIITDRLALEKMFGTIIKGMAYANGSCGEKSVEILKRCGIDYARTTVSTEKFSIPSDWLRLPATCHHKNPRLMELAEEFVKDVGRTYFWARENGPKMFYLWGHSYEFNDNDNWEIIEEFAEFIGNRDNVWYATNGEIYRYIKAFESLEFSADGDMVYNPTAIDVYLCYYSGNHKIAKAGEITFLR